MYWDAAESQYYAEPKRLEQIGFLSSRKEPGRTRERTHYTLTKMGRDAIAAWMRSPAAFPRIQHEPIVRLLAADLVGNDAVLASLRPLREQIADVAARLDVAEAMAATIPHRERYLLLNHRLARAILRVHSEWLDDVERELGPRARSLKRAGRAKPRKS